MQRRGPKPRLGLLLLVIAAIGVTKPVGAANEERVRQEEAQRAGSDAASPPAGDSQLEQSIAQLDAAAQAQEAKVTEARLAADAQQGRAQDIARRPTGTGAGEVTTKEVTAAAEEATRLNFQADAEAARLQSVRAEQQRMKTVLDARIETVRSEAASFQAEDARLSVLLLERQEAQERQLDDAAPADQAKTRIDLAPAPIAPGESAAQMISPTTIAAAPTPSTVPSPAVKPGRFYFPTTGNVSSEFGPRWGTLHPGLDIAAPQGTPIMAANSGTVVSAGWGGGYGNLVVVDHGFGYATAYAHQTKMAVTVGQAVTTGQVIGYVGSTGNSTGNHLHFETRINGKVQNPRLYL